jgi:DNA-binding IscR family transcriptional regulator
MRLSRRSEHGLRALVDLIRNDGNGPVALAVLAQRNDLPAMDARGIPADALAGRRP